MKRDLLLLTICLCVVSAVTWLAAGRSTPVSAGPGARDWVLVLDAGHGGEDGGACTAAGDKESDINLSIVLRMEQLMAFLGVEPVLTRDADVSIHSEGARTIHEKKVSDLKNRVALVDSIPNAILISVHQNYFTDSRYQGAQVFYSEGDLGRQWGEYTQQVLQQVLDPSNGRSAKPIPDSVYLFRHVSCPALLVECGFLSSGEEAALLLTDAYQRKISMALAGAYLHELQMLPTIMGGN